MDILLQSDGQLYPPRHMSPKEPPKKPKPPPPPAPKPPSPTAGKSGLSMEELLLMGIAFLIIRSSDQPDLPLLLALAYILFDQQFSLKGLF